MTEVTGERRDSGTKNLDAKWEGYWLRRAKPLVGGFQFGHLGGSTRSQEACRTSAKWEIKRAAGSGHQPLSAALEGGEESERKKSQNTAAH